MLLTALLLFIAGETARRLGGAVAARWLGLAFTLALGQALVGLALAPDAEKPFEGAGLAAFLAAGLTVFWWRRDPGRVSRTAATAALLALPLGPILFVQILSWRSWPACGPDRPGPAPRAGARPVYLLLFDEWSLARSERGGRLLPELANLRRLAARGTLYTEARSPGDATLESIPRMLYGENGEVVAGNGRARWRVGDSAVAALERPSLFRRAREQGYRTALAGWYLPYAALVGEDLDRCRAWPQVPKREGLARLVDLAWANLRHLPDPLSRAAWRALNARAFSANWYALERRVEEEAMRLAREGAPNTFALLHFPLPHAPFVFGAAGEYLGPFEEGRMFGTVEEYGRHLRYLDRVLGRFLDTLEAAGRLDSAVVVVTSDHSWKKDPDKRERVRERLRRVPLVVGRAGPPGSSGRKTCLLRLDGMIGHPLAPPSQPPPGPDGCEAP